MHWLQHLDVELFRFVNTTLANPAFDRVMPFLSGSDLARTLLNPLVLVAAALLVWKGRARGVLCVLMVVLAVAFCDGVVCRTLKNAVGRERPFLALTDVRCLVGKGGSGSMPSSHAANWFAATMVALIYYRRSLWFMLPTALAVSFSRVYNGAHYPGDVLTGAVLGAGSAAVTLLLANALWQSAGRKWFPLWWQGMPSLLTPMPQTEADAGGERFAKPEMADTRQDGGLGTSRPDLPKTRGIAPAGFIAPQVAMDAHWLRLGYLLIGVLLVARLAYIASGTIQLVEDEAYQWVWSKHLALSYFSKPPLIAYTQFLGTFLWGDNAFGVRFFSPVIGAVLSFLIFRFFAREVNARAGLFLLLIITATPLMAVGSTLMTVDPLSVLFWTAAMLAGWRAIQPEAHTQDWLWVGLWTGFGFLSKYTALLQLLCWVVLFVLWSPARRQLRRPGPWLALLVTLICASPVLIWNWQHQWATVGHVADNAGAGTVWRPTLRFLADFLGCEAGLLNPVFFVAAIWAAFGMWRRGRTDPRLVYFFSMGAPLFLVYLLYSFRLRILPNWIAPSVLPLFCLMVIYWDTRWRLGARRIKGWLITGLLLGFALVVLGLNTDLFQKATRHYLPVKLDPLHRVRQWDETARVVEQARQELLTEGKPVFIIADHYGMTGQILFHLPEARAAMRNTPLVYCRSSATPENQFFFWPGYGSRKGENAVYVRELGRDNPNPMPAPERLQGEFESVTDLGVRNVMYHGDMLLRPLQFFACRGLR